MYIVGGRKPFLFFLDCLSFVIKKSYSLSNCIMFSMYSRALVVALAAMLPGAMADPTPISDAQMVTYLGNEAIDLAYAYAP
jgi:hypothetical protein